MVSPLGETGSPYIIHTENNKPELPVIDISKENRPRQGLNTCGANKLFIFDSMKAIDEINCFVSGKNGEAILPMDLVYPLIGAQQFKENSSNRYVFLPYSNNGRVLTLEELKKFPAGYSYLLKHKEVLSARKGVLIGSSIKKGLWWSLLGIGPYSFAPWKIVWEAYGKKEFRPKLFSDNKEKLWQPNQALQAFLPFEHRKDAEEVLIRLRNPKIEKILKNQGMEGTCNWAQPGRMMKFFRFKNET